MSSKRKRGVEETDPRRLIMCITMLDHRGYYPILYKFESYPIDKFITESETKEELEPNVYFTWDEKGMDNAYEVLLKSKDGKDWREKMKVPSYELCTRTPTPPYCDMCFLNVGDIVYAVGGHKVAQGPMYFSLSSKLPVDFNSFSLRKALSNFKVETTELCKMKGKKYVSFIVEICGLIYVLSSPGYLGVQKPVFEAYDPLNDKWDDSLPEPPFFAFNFIYGSDLVSFLSDSTRKLKHMVIGAKLYVSSDFASSIYNTELRIWEVCNLFYGSDLPGCGAPFPFDWDPIPYKEKIILSTTCFPEVPVVAYHINDEERAVNVPIEFVPPIMGFTKHPLVDLGDDYFIAMLYNGSIYPSKHFLGADVPDDFYIPESGMTAVTFKLQLESGNGFSLKAKVKSMKKIKLAYGDLVRGVTLDYLCAFVYNPSSSD